MKEFKYPGVLLASEAKERACHRQVAAMSAVEPVLNQISVERSESTTSQSTFLSITIGYELWAVRESKRDFV